MAKSGQRLVVPPGLTEAGEVAWRASRKATLHGNLGTGNRIGSVIQYPVTSRDPTNLCRQRTNHLSAEDRRILRVRVKHYMKNKPGYPDSVAMAEKVLMKGFAEDSSLLTSFYMNESFATKLLDQVAHNISGGLSGALSRSSSDSSVMAKGRDVPSLRTDFSGHALNLKPSQHGPFCGPKCYCLRFNDMPLSVTAKDIEGFGSVTESYAVRSECAAGSVLDTALRHAMARRQATLGDGTEAASNGRGS